MSAFKDSTGAVTLPTVDPDGRLPVVLAGGASTGGLLTLLEEQNRLLRRLIFGLELVHNQEFPEVE